LMREDGFDRAAPQPACELHHGLSSASNDFLDLQARRIKLLGGIVAVLHQQLKSVGRWDMDFGRRKDVVLDYKHNLLVVIVSGSAESRPSH
jgi:hypothetical protein